MNVDYNRNDDVYDQFMRDNYEESRTSSYKKKFLVLFSAIACFCFVGYAVMGMTNNSQVSLLQEGSLVSLWERECYTCVKCQDDQMQIISVAYGDNVITGEFVQMYNNGVRQFPAGDATWGETWTGVKKTMVLTFIMCDNFYTKVITEGQALVLP